MYIPNLKIAFDDDSATYYDIQTAYSMLADLTVPWATPKTSALSVMGINGITDLTESFGAVYYNSRKLGLRLTVKNDAVLPAESIVNSFAQLYDGQRVRIKVIATNDYFFVGRLTITADDEKEKLRQITCAIDADPLRYDTSYTPSTSGLDITPENLGANLWSAANVTPPYPETHVTASGASIDADAEDSEGVAFDVNDTIVGSGKLLRIYTQNINNCEVMIAEYDGENERIVVSGVTGTALYMSNGNRLIIKAFRKNTSSAASFGCTIREITTHTVNNAGKAIPFEIKNTFYSNTTAKTKIYANGTVFAPKQILSGAWQEYAPAVLKSGNNIIAAFVDSGSYDSAQSGGELRIRYRKGVL